MTAHVLVSHTGDAQGMFPSCTCAWARVHTKNYTGEACNDAQCIGSNGVVRGGVGVHAGKCPVTRGVLTKQHSWVYSVVVSSRMPYLASVMWGV